MLLDLRSLWEGAPFVPPTPPVVVQAVAPYGGAAWIGDGTSQLIRRGEDADEEFMEFLILDGKRRH